MFLFLAVSFRTAGQTTPKEMLNNAIYQEEVNGDLEKAMALYTKLVKDYPDDRAIVAEALYRMGLANEKLGTKKAKEYYEKVVSGYTDQPEMVKLARTRLSSIMIVEKSISGSWLERTKKEGQEIYSVDFYEKSPGQKEDKALEGSSISPDGTKIAGVDFSLGQNVALFDLNTREIQLMTKYKWSDDNGAITYYPVWSPDGKEIAFSYEDNDGDNIKVATLDGRTRDLLKSGSFKQQVIPRQWFKDGNSILVFKQDSSGYFAIGMVAATGGDFKELCKTQWKGSNQLGVMPKGDASLSPDGRFIVFSDGPADNMNLYIMDVKGGTPALLSGHPNSEYSPLWSPDGKSIVFIRETNGDALLFAMKIENGKAAGQPSLLKEGMQNVGLKAWTSHGITYYLYVNIHDIYTLSVDPVTGVPNGNPELLQYSPTGSNIQPVWSHNGKYLAFVTYGLKNQLVLLPASGGNARYYTIDAPGFWELSLYDLNWLPDDSGLSFSNPSPDGIFTVHCINLATEKWQQWALSNAKQYTRTASGPEKNSMVYGQSDSQGIGIYKFITETKQSVKIHDLDLNEEYVVFGQVKFSRDMKKLACNLQCSEGAKMLILDMESGRYKVFDKSRFSTFSPDGKKFIARESDAMTVYSEEGNILAKFDIRQYFPEGALLTSFDWSPDGKQLAINSRTIIYKELLMRNVLNQW